MARLTSLARVLESLDIPPEGSPGWPDFAPPGAPPGATQGWDGPTEGIIGARAAGRPEPADPAGPRTGPAGYEVWDSARRQAEFYAAYAELLEGRDVPTAGREDQAREWAGPAALATAYRLAAQHAALVDAGWATRLAVRAAMAYLTAGLPFGLFLLTGLLDDQTLRESTVVRDVVTPFAAPGGGTAAARHPVQQTYLLLAAASRPWLRAPLGSVLSGARERLAAHSLRPVGAQSVPLGDYLDLADLMLYDDQRAGRQRDGSVRYVARRLAAMHRAQAATLRAAQRNRYLWRQGASPVNIIDLEHVALSGLALRHRPWFGQLSAAVADELDRDDPLTELPVWTMGTIEARLPDIAPTVVDIMREPERPRRTEDFRDPEPVVPPWNDEARYEPPAARNEEDRTRTEPRLDSTALPDEQATRLYRPGPDDADWYPDAAAPLAGDPDVGDPDGEDPYGEDQYGEVRYGDDPYRDDPRDR